MPVGILHLCLRALMCVFAQFRVFLISSSVDITAYQYGKKIIFFYNIAQGNIKYNIKITAGNWREIFRAVHQSAFSVQNLQMQYYNNIFITDTGSHYYYSRLHVTFHGKTYAVYNGFEKRSEKSSLSV